MIRLDCGYAIDVDSNCYTLGIPKMTKVVNKKTGEETSKEILTECKYYNSLNSALIGYWSLVRKRGLTDFEGLLQDALKVVQKQDEKVLALMSKVLKEVK